MSGGPIPAYPLQWPAGWKRAVSRKSGLFRRASQSQGSSTAKLSVAVGVERVRVELGRLGIPDYSLVISTNVALKLDGFPRSDLGEPGDPGVAVYWVEKNDARRVMAIDIYDRVADNLAAVAASLEALRAIERHGGAMILERAFTGFTALPPPGATREWWEVLGVPRKSTREAVKRAYRELASRRHPDKPGGSHSAMAELNAAQEAALLECFT